MLKKTFRSSGTFSAYYAASEWLGQHGYSVGSMERDYPIGIKKGSYSIAKWTNLSDSDRFLLDGVLRSDDFREGDVTLLLTNYVEDEEELLEKAENRDMSLLIAEEERRSF